MRGKRLLSYINSDGTMICVLLLVCVLFFAKLLFPTLQIFFIPDGYYSDYYNINYALKSILSSSLRSGHFPYWTWNTGNGFPLISESQIGAFYLPNILISLFFTFPTSFHVGYMVTYAIGSIGMYCLLRLHTKRKILSALIALLFVNSASFTMQVVHTNLQQTLSLVPWILFFWHSMIVSKNVTQKIRWFILAIVFSTQQFFAGYVLVVYMTQLFVFMYAFIIQPINRKTIIKTIAVYAVYGVCILLSSSVQLIPLIEYVFYSTRSQTGGGFAVSESFKIPMLASLFSYNIHNVFTETVSGLASVSVKSDLKTQLWDANLFTGILFIPILIISTIAAGLNRQRILFIVLIILSLFLALGGNGPLSFIYAFPPFTFFRTPMRFGFFIVFFSLLLLVSSTDSIMDSKHNYLNIPYRIFVLLIYISIVLSIVSLVSMFSTLYHVVKPDSIFESGNISYLQNKMAKSNENNRVFSMGNEIVWYQHLVHYPWKNISIYPFLEQTVAPYANEIISLPMANIFFASGFGVKNQTFADSLTRIPISEDVYKNNILFSFDPVIDYRNFISNVYTRAADINEITLALFRLKGVKYFLSPFLFSSSDAIRLIREDVYTDQGMIYHNRLYGLTDPYNELYVPDQYVQINVPEDFMYLARNHYFNLGTHIFGFDPNFPIITQANVIVKRMSDNNSNITYKITADKSTILATTLSYYPGIQIIIDGNITSPIPINFNQFAFPIQAGHHTVIIRYSPSWKQLSQYITIFMHVLLLSILVAVLSKVIIQKFSTHGIS